MASIAQIVKDTAGDIGSAITLRATKKTPPDAIMEHIDHAGATIGKKLWRGTLAVMASGFGKGVLYSAIAIVAGIGIYGGLLGAFGGTGADALLVVGNKAITSFGAGLAAGIERGIGFLLGTTGSGWFGASLVALGGMFGAVVETRKAQSELGVEIAQARAQNFEIARQLGRAQAQTIQPNTAQEKTAAKPSMQTFAGEIPECTHCARELERRANAQQQIRGIA